VTSGRRTGSVVVTSLDSADRMVLRDSDSTNVAYSAGHLLFLTGRTLMAQPFDPDRLTLSGTPFPIADDIQTLGSPYYGFFAASPGGVLAYQTSVTTGALQLTWIDRAGKPLATIGTPANYGDLALSPDGKKAAVSLIGDQNDIWLIDLEREGLATRFTFDDASEITPIWSPDGSRLAFGSLPVGDSTTNIIQKAATGAGSAESLLTLKFTNYLTSWSPDRRFVLYTEVASGGDVWVLPLAGERKPFLFAGGSLPQQSAQFSPMAGGSRTSPSSRSQRDLHGTVRSGRTGGGQSGGCQRVAAQPRWSPDGKGSSA
jgi:dipeptidyl aminopeptidase/acylaminoacyl peptidase